MSWISKLWRLCSSNEQQREQPLNTCKGVKTGRSPKTVFTPFLTFLLRPPLMLTVKRSRSSPCTLCRMNRNNGADFCFPTCHFNPRARQGKNGFVSFELSCTLPGAAKRHEVQRYWRYSSQPRLISYCLEPCTSLAIFFIELYLNITRASSAAATRHLHTGRE